MADQSAESKASSYFTTYAEHRRVLRTWLVAYGVGGPILVLTNKDVWMKVSASPNSDVIAIMFAVGVASQVLIAFTNKVALWLLYFGEEKKGFKDTCIYKAGDWISEQFWMDFLSDIISIGAFGWATYEVFLIFFGST